MGFEEDVKAVIDDAVKQAGNPNALALKCGINQATLSRWLNGKRDPQLSGVAKIMDYMGVTIQRPDADPLVPPAGSKGLHSSIMEAKQREEIARLQGQVDLLKELMGAPPKKEKSAG